MGEQYNISEDQLKMEDNSGMPNCSVHMTDLPKTAISHTVNKGKVTPNIKSKKPV